MNDGHRLNGVPSVKTIKSYIRKIFSNLLQLLLIILKKFWMALNISCQDVLLGLKCNNTSFILLTYLTKFMSCVTNILPLLITCLNTSISLVPLPNAFCTVLHVLEMLRKMLHSLGFMFSSKRKLHAK